MKRLTTDNPQGNIQTELNLFYVKDHQTMVRGGSPAPDWQDVPLYDFTRQLIKTYIPDWQALNIDDDENLSEMMAEWMFDGPENIEGLIATLYTAAWAFSELRFRLAAYEDTGLDPEEIKDMAENAETRLLTWFESRYGFPAGELMHILEVKQAGRLVLLPCKVGDIIYRIDVDPLLDSKEITPYRIDNIVYCDDGEVLLKYDAYDGVICTLDNLVNGTPYLDYYLSFLTREEAAAALNGGSKNGQT